MKFKRIFLVISAGLLVASLVYMSLKWAAWDKQRDQIETHVAALNQLSPTITYDQCVEFAEQFTNVTLPAPNFDAYSIKVEIRGMEMYISFEGVEVVGTNWVETDVDGNTEPSSNPNSR